MSMKVHVFSFNMILLSSPKRVTRPSYPLRSNFEGTGIGSITVESKVVNKNTQCSPRESTCSKLQYDPYLISVACVHTVLSTSEKLWGIR